MNHNSNHLRQYYTCLVFADNRKTARRIWRDICRLHSSGRCSPAERQSAFISLQNEVRDAAIYGADRLYSEHPDQLPETMLAYQNVLSFLFGSSLDSMPRCGDYELTAQYRPMILSLGHCETAEQVEKTAQELKWMVEDLPLEAKDACYRLMTHTVEDAILADYRDAVTRLHGTWYDRYLLSLLDILEHPAYEEYTLDFTLFDGNRFTLVDAESLADCNNVSRLRKMTHILRTALRRLPTDRREAAIECLATHLPATVINRMQHTTHAEESTTTILLRLALTLASTPAQWLTNDSLADWVVGESREVKMAG